MLDNQQLDSLTLAINKAIGETLSNTHTSTIAKVTKVQEKTISVKPVFKRIIDGVEVELPEFVEIPILTLQGGSNYRIMPISIGDTALLVFSERCIDDWFVGGSANAKPRTTRMHDYSDAIAIVGLNTLNEAISIPQGYEKVNGNIVHTGDNTQTGDYDLTGNIVQTGDYDLTGNATVSGLTTTNTLSVGSTTGSQTTSNVKNANLVFDENSDITINGVSLVDFIDNHTHGGVQSGVSDTSTPNPL